jgi:hypothetical protein
MKGREENKEEFYIEKKEMREFSGKRPSRMKPHLKYPRINKTQVPYWLPRSR